MPQLPSQHPPSPDLLYGAGFLVLFVGEPQQPYFICFPNQNLVQDDFERTKMKREWKGILRNCDVELFYFHLFDKYLLSAYHASGTLLAAKCTLMNKSDILSGWVGAPAGNSCYTQEVIKESQMKKQPLDCKSSLGRELQPPCSLPGRSQTSLSPGDQTYLGVRDQREPPVQLSGQSAAEPWFGI